MIQTAQSAARFAILWHTMPPAGAAMGDDGSRLLEDDAALKTLPSSAVRTSHFDLLLQSQSAALTWELPRLPMQGESFTVRRLPDHRLMYLDYEGPLTQGRGQVVAWDRGELIWQVRHDRHVQVLLFGERLTAQVAILEPQSSAALEDATTLWDFTAKLWQIGSHA